MVCQALTDPLAHGAKIIGFPGPSQKFADPALPNLRSLCLQVPSSLPSRAVMTLIIFSASVFVHAKRGEPKGGNPNLPESPWRLGVARSVGPRGVGGLHGDGMLGSWFPQRGLARLMAELWHGGTRDPSKSPLRSAMTCPRAGIRCSSPPASPSLGTS